MEKAVEKYFSTRMMRPSDELSASEARARGDYVLGHFTGGKPERAEIVRGGALRSVVYFDGDANDESLKARHLSRYGCPFEIVQPTRMDGGLTVREAFHYGADGTLSWVGGQHVDARGVLIKEVRRGPDRSVETTTEYEYDEEGEMRLSRIRNRDGVVISEDELFD
jgi:hypothetical protein